MAAPPEDPALWELAETITTDVAVFSATTRVFRRVPADVQAICLITNGPDLSHALRLLDSFPGFPVVAVRVVPFSHQGNAGSCLRAMHDRGCLFPRKLKHALEAMDQEGPEGRMEDYVGWIVISTWEGVTFIIDMLAIGSPPCGLQQLLTTSDVIKVMERPKVAEAMFRRTWDWQIPLDLDHGYVNTREWLGGAKLSRGVLLHVPLEVQPYYFRAQQDDDLRWGPNGTLGPDAALRPLKVMMDPGLTPTRSTEVDQHVRAVAASTVVLGNMLLGELFRLSTRRGRLVTPSSSEGIRAAMTVLLELGHRPPLRINHPYLSDLVFRWTSRVANFHPPISPVERSLIPGMDPQLRGWVLNAWATRLFRTTARVQMNEFTNIVVDRFGAHKRLSPGAAFRSNDVQIHDLEDWMVSKLFPAQALQPHEEELYPGFVTALVRVNGGGIPQMLGHAVATEAYEEVYRNTIRRPGMPLHTTALPMSEEQEGHGFETVQERDATGVCSHGELRELREDIIAEVSRALCATKVASNDALIAFGGMTKSPQRDRQARERPRKFADRNRRLLGGEPEYEEDWNRWGESLTH